MPCTWSPSPPPTQDSSLRGSLGHWDVRPPPGQERPPAGAQPCCRPARLLPGAPSQPEFLGRVQDADLFGAAARGRSPDPRRPAPQIEACQDLQNTDDDPNFLYPSEARIAPETKGIGEERDSGNECANADQGRCGRPGHRNKLSIRSPDPPLQERGRDRQAEGLRGFKVDDQFELCGLLDGQ